MDLLPINPNTRPEQAERIARRGGRASLRQRWRVATGSPFVWYVNGWDALDAVQNRAPDLLRLSVERLQSGLLLHASQRHDAWFADFPLEPWLLQPANPASGSTDSDAVWHLVLEGVTLGIRIPAQHRRRFFAFAQTMEAAKPS